MYESIYITNTFTRSASNQHNQAKAPNEAQEPNIPIHVNVVTHPLQELSTV
jgi:hypothetical protein